MGRMVTYNATFKAKADDVIDLPLDTAHVMPAEQTLMVRDYCGNHIYRNGVLERVLNSGVYLISLYYNNQLLETKQIIK